MKLFDAWVVFGPAIRAGDEFGFFPYAFRFRRDAISNFLMLFSRAAQERSNWKWDNYRRDGFSCKKVTVSITCDDLPSRRQA